MRDLDRIKLDLLRRRASSPEEAAERARRGAALARAALAAARNGLRTLQDRHGRRPG